MAHYLAELYSPKQAWLNLSSEERLYFLNQVGAAMPALAALGVEAISLGTIDQTKLSSSKNSFYAIWRCNDNVALDALVNGIAQSGWHTYFDTINAGGEGGDFNDHLQQLIALN
ncbi:DUF6616 family protein [Paenochrobactrum sp. BZR 588]|uniref:DUF6616 family protein n=1 Tax=Paenochrobactrum TaxID=999488 RepID=UPI0035BC2D27